MLNVKGTAEKIKSKKWQDENNKATQSSKIKFLPEKRWKLPKKNIESDSMII